MVDPHATNARDKLSIGDGTDWPVLAPAPVPSAIVTSRDKSPTFSILVAAYEVADVIGEALESAFAQTHRPLEVIVCDDGSTDELERALEPYRERIVLTRTANGGEGSAKNTAAQLAQGDFLAILDADDRYLPRRLEALAHLARTRPDLDLLTTDAYLEASGRIVRRCYAEGWTFEAENQRRAILQRNFLFGHVAVRRELFLRHGGFDESIRRTADWDCWLRMILDGARAGAVMEPLSIYRVRMTSLSADRPAMARGKIETLEKALVSGALRRGDLDVVRRALERYRREQDLQSLQATLADGRAGVRPLAAKLAVARHLSLRDRLEAVAALAAPGLVGRAQRRRARRFWVGAGGVKVERGHGPAAGPPPRR
jgi:Glycosyl transferase family 2